MAKRSPPPDQSRDGPALPKAHDPAWRMMILSGPEAFLRQHYTTLAKQTLTRTHGNIDVLYFDGESTPASDVLDECRSFGLIATHKLIIVDQADKLVKEDNRPLFERYAQSPESGTTLVLRSRDFKPGKLDALVEACGVIIHCATPEESTCVRWAVNRSNAAHGVAITPEAATLLVERVGADLGRLDCELAKLASATAEGGEIGTELVEEFVGVSREEEAWGVQRTMLHGNMEMALGHVRHVLEVSREPATLVMYAMTDLARKVHGMSRARRSGESARSAMVALKLWGPSQSQIMHAAERVDPRDALQLLRECVRQDMRSKSGFTDGARALEVLTWHTIRTLSH